ncbi:hypothetical protein D3C84_1031640 [compost metagenome]
MKDGGVVVEDVKIVSNARYQFCYCSRVGCVDCKCPNVDPQHRQLLCLLGESCSIARTQYHVVAFAPKT